MASESSTGSAADHAGKLVLVVEDDAAMARLLKDSFSYEGYRVLVTGDGASALDLAVRRVTDLIILDIMLPGMDGLTVCSELRKKKVRSSVIMLTARNLEGDKVAGLKSGADDYLTKPFSVAELLARAEAVLRRTSPDQNRVFSFGDMWVISARSRPAVAASPSISRPWSSKSSATWSRIAPGDPPKQDADEDLGL